MAQRGRPPKPTEQKRLLGNPGKRALPEVTKVLQLPQARERPPYPGDLDLEGRQLWDRTWAGAAAWLSPATDIGQVEEACRLADDVAKARARYRATGDPQDARALVALSKQLTDALSALGFNPTARARLGVAEVTSVSKLEALRRKTNR